jgi:acyl-CoA thioesterase
VRLAPPTGGISVDLTTHVHRPLDGLDNAWLAATFEITESAGGLALEHGRIATAEGLLVAESFHTRLTATR